MSAPSQLVTFKQESRKCTYILPSYISRLLFQILNHLKQHVSLDKSGRLQPDTLALFMTLLYCLDLEPITEQDCDNSLLQDANFTKSFHRVLLFFLY